MFKPEKWIGKKACVLGLGKSGRSAAELLASRGFSVLISEEAPVAHANRLSFLPGIEVETGGHSSRVFECDFWIKSPGIFPQNPVLMEAK